MRHESLVAWQRADDLVIEVHKVTQMRFPADQRFELSAQLRRAAFSVAANIVEGFARDTPRERLRFLHISKGSLAEVGYALHVAHRLGYVDDAAYNALDARVRRVAAPLLGLLRQYGELARGGFAR